MAFDMNSNMMMLWSLVCRKHEMFDAFAQICPISCFNLGFKLLIFHTKCFSLSLILGGNFEWECACCCLFFVCVSAHWTHKMCAAYIKMMGFVENLLIVIDQRKNENQIIFSPHTIDVLYINSMEFFLFFSSFSFMRFDFIALLTVTYRILCGAIVGFMLCS